MPDRYVIEENYAGDITVTDTLIGCGFHIACGNDIGEVKISIDNCKLMIKHMNTTDTQDVNMLKGLASCLDEDGLLVTGLPEKLKEVHRYLEVRNIDWRKDG